MLTALLIVVAYCLTSYVWYYIAFQRASSRGCMDVLGVVLMPFAPVVMPLMAYQFCKETIQRRFKRKTT